MESWLDAGVRYGKGNGAQNAVLYFLIISFLIVNLDGLSIWSDNCDNYVGRSISVRSINLRSSNVRWIFNGLMVYYSVIASLQL